MLAAGPGVLTGGHFAFEAKGVAAPMHVSDVYGLENPTGGGESLRLAVCEPVFDGVPVPLEIAIQVISGKKLDGEMVPGRLRQIAWKEGKPIAAVLGVGRALGVLDNLRMTFPDCGALPGEAYAKVTACGGDGEESGTGDGRTWICTVRLTSLAPTLATALEALRGGG